MKKIRFLHSIILLVALLSTQCGNAFVSELYINQKKASKTLSKSNKAAFHDLISSFSAPMDPIPPDEFFYTIETIDYEACQVSLKNGAVGKLGKSYRKEILPWKPSHRLKISKEGSRFKFENIDTQNHASGVFDPFSNNTHANTIVRTIQSIFLPDQPASIQLNNGMILKEPNPGALSTAGWKSQEKIFVLHHEGSTTCFDLWNTDRNEVVKGWCLDKNSENGNDILSLEKRLNQHVLVQTEATKSLADRILNYSAGLNYPNSPIGTFLFIGPTGVGKTELAKALASELFQTQALLIRLDMSQFSEPHSISRLIGAPPGYVGHEKGGQLTEAIKAHPRSIVLLDEIEKADSAVRKAFLPVFDDGYIIDAKNNKISCTNVIFIMTSNLCSSEMIELYKDESSSENVLKIIEPVLMKVLSPELYNRVEPVLFKPIGEDAFGKLVNLMLHTLTARIRSQKNINITIGNSVHEYLARHGYHSTLGARPLKRLIEKKVMASLAYAIVHDGITPGSHVHLSYNASDDSWAVEWRPAL